MSRNTFLLLSSFRLIVTSREGRVSRNITARAIASAIDVTSREGRVSRNIRFNQPSEINISHVLRGACE